MRFFKKSTLLVLPLLFSVLLLFQACDDDNTGPTAPDFSSAPDPYDLSEADTSYTIEGDVEIYIIEEGDCPGGDEDFCTVNSRDQISLKYTGRILDDETIFETTYANDNTEPVVISNLTSNPTDQQAAQVEGFRQGLLGMKEGEKRVIIVPPSMGYDDSNPGVNGMDLRDETLRYDVELMGIQE